MVQKQKTSSRLDESLRLLAKTSLIVLVGVVISKIFTWLYRIVVARSFGPEMYGLLTLATMVAGMLFALCSFGLHEGLVRFIPLYRGKNEGKKIIVLFRVSLKLFLGAGIIGAALMYVSAEKIAESVFHSPALVPFLQFFSFLVPVTILSSAFLSVLRAHEYIGWYSFVMNVVQSVSKFLFLALFVFLGLRADAIIFSTLLGAVLMLLAGYVLVNKKLPHLFSSSVKKKEDLHEVFSYSWPLLLLGIISIVNYWADSFALGYFRNPTEVGLYNAAVPLALLLLMVPDLFIQLFFPLITREFGKKNHEQIKELSKQVTKWITALNLPLFMILLIFPGTIINIFFDARYLAAEQALRFLAVGAFLTSLATVPSTLLSMIGKSRLILLNTLAALGLNIFLNALLVPSYGMNGAAIATMVSYIVLYVLFLGEAKHLLRFVPFRRKMVTLFVLSGILLAITFFAKEVLAQLIPLTLPVLLVFGFVFVVLYLLLVAAFGLDKHDDAILKLIWRKLLRKA